MSYPDRRSAECDPATSLWAVYRPVLGLAAVALLLIGGVMASALFALGCSESGDAGSDQTSTCESIGDFASPEWWASALWPTGLLGLALLTPWARRHVLTTILTVAALAAAFYVVMLT